MSNIVSWEEAELQKINEFLTVAMTGLLRGR